jgi:hypothetical protein
MNSRFLPIMFIVACLANSCKKPANNPVPASSLAFSLDSLNVSGDIVILKWSKLNNDSLTGYYIAKTTDTNQTPTLTFVDKNITQYSDTLPLTPYVQYYIVAHASSHGLMSVNSNKKTYVRTDFNFVHIAAMDALYDRSSHYLYIYSLYGDIAIYDVATDRLIKQIATNAMLGYADLGTFNGRKELYVPRSDGWLFIYDANTLDEIDQINVGYSLTSSVYNNGLLFTFTTDPNSHDSVIVFSRPLKSQISSMAISMRTFMKLAPGTNSSFFGINESNNVFYYRFDNSGIYLSQKSAKLNSFSPAYDFEIFPDGTKAITAPYGVIVDSSLTYISTMSNGSLLFNSFAIDNTNQLIYASCKTKQIQAYAMSNYQAARTITTEGYPTKVFSDNGTVICVSESYYPYYYTRDQYTFVEKF